MIYAPEFESLPREEMEQLQIERLQTTLNRVVRNVEFYRRKFDELNIDINTITSIRDLQSLPFTVKGDLNDAYPYAMFAVPLKDVVRIHSTSGATGRPLVVGYTRNDIEHWSGLVARLLCAAGVTEHDFVQVAFHYSLFTGGLGFHYGAERLGASVVPSSEGSDMEKQIMIMKDYNITALVSTPSFADKIALSLKEGGVRPDSLHLKRGIFGAEPWSEKQRARLETSLHISAFDNYGVSEVMGPGIAFECETKNGLHVNEDHFIVEVVDPKTLARKQPGEQGELVFTTIAKEGFPLVRYRTGDLASLVPGTCPCGRTTARISRIAGRTDDLIIVKGVKFFPGQIGAILAGVEGVSPCYQIVLDKKHGVDGIEVKVEVSEDLPFFDEIKKLEAMAGGIARAIKRKLNIQPKVTLVEPNSLKPAAGKAMDLVIDRRGE